MKPEIKTALKELLMAILAVAAIFIVVGLLIAIAQTPA